jgi:hypothetical protein
MRKGSSKRKMVPGKAALMSHHRSVGKHPLKGKSRRVTHGR